MLVSLLRDHREITCFGELFRKDHTGGVKFRPGDALTITENLDPKWQSKRLRRKNPAAFLDEVIAHGADTRTVGFKLMLSQHQGFMRELIADPSYKKILLTRENALAAYSSEMIASKTGQGSAREGQEVVHAKIRFKSRSFRFFRWDRDRRYRAVRNLLSASGAPFLEIEYLELADRSGISRVIDFLGVDSEQDVRPFTLKRNSSELLERFNNPDDVVRTLKAMGLERWQIERPSGWSNSGTGVTGAIRGV